LTVLGEGEEKKQGGGSEEKKRQWVALPRLAKKLIHVNSQETGKKVDSASGGGQPNNPGTWNNERDLTPGEKEKS